MSRPVWCLAELYKLTGDQRYLDRAIQISEEIIAWQDFKDIRDPWGEPLNQDSSWDGGWYYYNYSPQPIPNTCQPNLGWRDGFAADRRMGYHTAILYSLIKLLEVTQQQILPGTTTIRNGNTFYSFRNRLRNSIKRGLNFMIANQEENNSYPRYRGLFKEYKNYRDYLNNHIIYDPNYTSAPHGLSTLVDGYSALLKTNSLSTQDKSRLISLINGVSTNMLSKYQGNWAYNEWLTEGMMMNWSRFISFLSNIPSSTLSLINNGFEEKSIVWELWSWEGTGVTISSSVFRTGNKSVHIFDTNTNASKWASILLTATPNTYYRVHGYLKLLQGTLQSIYIQYYDANYNFISEGCQVAYPQPNWQLVSYSSTSPTNTAFLRIILYSPWYHVSDGYWDDITLRYPKEDIQYEESIKHSELSSYNYPNPFNPSTNISYHLPRKADVELRIYDLLGKEVKSFIFPSQTAGIQHIVWNGTNNLNELLASGIYVYRIITTSLEGKREVFEKSAKLVLTK